MNQTVKFKSKWQKRVKSKVGKINKNRYLIYDSDQIQKMADMIDPVKPNTAIDISNTPDEIAKSYQQIQQAAQEYLKSHPDAILPGLVISKKSIELLEKNTSSK